MSYAAKQGAFAFLMKLLMLFDTIRKNGQEEDFGD